MPTSPRPRRLPVPAPACTARTAPGGRGGGEGGGEARSGRAPPPPGPGHSFPAPGRRRASPRLPSNASPALLGAGSPSSPPPGGLAGPTEARAGAQGGREVVDSGRGERVEESLRFRQRRRRSRGADAECAARPFVQVAGQPLSGRCQSNPPSLESPPEALPSRVPAEPRPRWPLFPVRAVPASPGLWASTRALLGVRSSLRSLPHAPLRRPRGTPSGRPLQLEKAVGTRKAGSVQPTFLKPLLYPGSVTANEKVNLFLASRHLVLLST